MFGTDGNRTNALDGWGVFGKDAELLGAIEDAAFDCEVQCGFDGVLTLVDKDGKIYPLQSDVEQPKA